MLSFFTECKNNKYGSNCSETCGNCRDLSQCHYINGSCLNGCGPGFLGEKCNIGIVFFAFVKIVVQKSLHYHNQNTFSSLQDSNVLQNVAPGITEWNAFKNIVHFANNHVTVIMLLNFVEMVVKQDGLKAIALKLYFVVVVVVNLFSCSIFLLKCSIFIESVYKTSLD